MVYAYIIPYHTDHQATCFLRQRFKFLHTFILTSIGQLCSYLCFVLCCNYQQTLLLWFLGYTPKLLLTQQSGITVGGAQGNSARQYARHVPYTLYYLLPPLKIIFKMTQSFKLPSVSSANSSFEHDVSFSTQRSFLIHLA